MRTGLLSAVYMKNKLDYSRELDIWIWSNKPEIVKSADFLFSKIMKNIGGKFDQNRVKNHLKVFLTDIFVAHKQDNKLFISFSRNKNSYRVSKRFDKIYLRYKYVILVTDFLIEHGYVEYHKGIKFSHYSRESRIRATQKLLRLFRKYRSKAGVILRRNPPVILRDEDKQDIDFDMDTLEVKTIIRNVNRINKCLDRHLISADVPWEEYADFMLNCHINEQTKKYVRIFNNSDFKQGGRFYFHWSQMIKSEIRKNITIDGKQTVELDYSCLHLSMLYGLENMVPPAGDLYTLAGIDSCFRPIIKKAVNIAINARNETSAMQAIREEITQLTEKMGFVPPGPKTILENLKQAHSPIKKYFCTGYGVRLQYLDSSIAEQIMLSLAEEDICCLCIHDSFIVAKEHKALLHELMMNKFAKLFNFRPRISIK